MEGLLKIENLSVNFRTGRGSGTNRKELKAVNDISFSIGKGEVFGLVGESGSGKSTTARAILNLIPHNAASIKFHNTELTSLSRRQFRPVRKKIQMIFQDPYSSLDPSMVLSELIAEPLYIHSNLSRLEIRSRVEDALDSVGLSRTFINRYPHEFSGGQRQRIAIARAIVLQPDLLICDEAVSALDVSTQNQIINLLEALQVQSRMSYLFISHDLAVVRHISHRVAVIYLGQIVEQASVDQLFDQPLHPYTQTLLSAIPIPNPTLRRKSVSKNISVESPDPLNPPSGCTFHPRCNFVMDICRVQAPPLKTKEDGSQCSCWL